MLKSKITKEDHAALPEPVQAHYKAEGDAFVLDTEGTVSKADLDAANQKLVEFRNNNQALNAKVAELDTLKTKFKDVDPAEYERVKGELEALKTKGVTKPDDVDTKVTAAVTAAVKPLADQLAESDRKRAESDDALKQSRLRHTLTTAAFAGKATKEAAYTVVDKAIAIFDVDENGNIKAKEGYYSADNPTVSLPFEEWLTERAKGDMHFAFETSKGGGSGEPGGGPPPSTAKQVKRDGVLTMSQAELQDMASGKSELSD